MTEPHHDSIGQILSTIIADGQTSAQERVADLLCLPEMDDITDSVSDLNPEHFDLLFNFPIRDCTETVVSEYLSDTVVDRQRLLFLFIHAQFVELHFQRLFQQHEGSTNAADKSRTLLRALAHFFATGEAINFDYSGKNTSHLPQKIFTHHQVIYDFYEGLYRLYYGQPELYLEALGVLLDSQE